MKLDELDYKLIYLLQENSRQPLNVLEEKLGQISTSTIHSRIKRLEKNGYVKNYTLNLNYKAIGFPIVAHIMVNFDKNDTSLDQETVANQIAQLPRVQEVHIIAGEYDILIKVRARDIEDLGQFVSKELKEVEGIGNSRTFISLNTIKETEDPPFITSKMVDFD